MNILDAVCVLFFSASGQLDVLVQTLVLAGYRIYLPEEVLKEAKRRARANGWNIRKLDGALHLPGVTPLGENGQRVKPIVVIPEISAAEPDEALALTQVTRRHPKLAGRTSPSVVLPSSALNGSVSQSEHLGECVVVAHAALARRRGLQVVVSIDDLDGQTLAKGLQLPIFTVEDAICAAVAHGVLTTPAARKAYDRLRGFGDSLPTWEASGLAPRLKREARQRKAAAAAAGLGPGPSH